MTKFDLFEVTFTALAYGGDALGRLPDGRAVFVPFVLPGEMARVRLVEEKPRYANGEIVEILQPSSERIAPRCIHFGYCGGCHYQHLPYEAQLAAKTAILKDQLERIGRLPDPPVHPAIPSAREYYYRNHVQFTLTAEGKLAYHKLHSEDVFAVQECHLPEEPINAIWPQLEFEPQVDLERIGLRLGAGEDVQVTLESDEFQAPEMSVEDLPLSIVHLSPAGGLVLAGSDYVVMEVLDRPFRVSAGSFFQVNTPMAEGMVEHILENLQLRPDMTVMDVYSGVGLFSAFLAPKVGRLVAVESSLEAGEDFVVNLDEFENVELYEGLAEDVLPRLELKPDLVLVDPPRAGLERAARDAILAMSPPVLVYVSCDPSTLARDGRRLSEAGYRLRQITPFDLFPQTFHIESISFWEK
jgi:23S rRNA (uracil1939-C5)-methyltransferase